MSHSFYWGHRPALRRCNQSGRCTAEVLNNGQNNPEKNTSYYGNGFYQRIATHHAHTQFDWIVRNNLLNHTTIAFDRWFMGGNHMSAGAMWPQRLWAGTPGAGVLSGGGLVTPDAGPPEIRFFGNIPYNELGDYGWPRFGFLTNNRWQFSDDLSWVKNRHTLKVGFEYRHHQFPFKGWAAGATGGQFDFNNLETAGYDSTGKNLSGQTGESFASFLLGQVHFSTQTIPAYPTFYEAYMAPWINDEFKATSRLTLTLGLRFDYEFPRTEMHNQYSTFDPNTPNPGAGNLPGAMIFAGSGPGRAGTRTFEKPNADAWGPRLGFAYRVGDKAAIRGGYGIYYSGISFDQFIGQPTQGFQSNPSVVSINNGQTPAFFLDAGFPQVSATLCAQNPGNLCITRPPFIDPTFENNNDVIAVAKNGLKLPRYQNWSLTFERELTSNMRLDVSYIANRGTRLTSDWQKMGIGANMNNPSILTTYTQAQLAAPPATPPFPGFSGDLAQALRLYPQYHNVLWRDVPLGSSMYNALEVVLEQRVSHGLQFRFGYTYSRLNNDGSETGQGGDGANGNVQNPACPHTCEWGLSRDDTPNVFLVGYSYELPGARRWKGAAGALLGGWNLSGVLRYESGRPLNIFMNNTLGGLLFNGQLRPDRVKGVSGVVSRSHFNPNVDKYLNKSGWVNPAGTFGNAPRSDGTVRGWPNYNEDLSVFKEFTLREQLKMRFTVEGGNIFNRTNFCDPDRNLNDGSFGQISTQCNQPRSFQLGLRLSY